MRMLKGEIFPFALILTTTEAEFYKLAGKDSRIGAFPLPGTANTYSFTEEGTGVIIIVALGSELVDSVEGETESILTHEAVHVKQFVFESIGEETIGVETEAYFVQYIADYLIRELHYRLNKEAAKKAKEEDK